VGQPSAAHRSLPDSLCVTVVEAAPILARTGFIGKTTDEVRAMIALRNWHAGIVREP